MKGQIKKIKKILKSVEYILLYCTDFYVIRHQKTLLRDTVPVRMCLVNVNKQKKFGVSTILLRFSIPLRLH